MRGLWQMMRYHHLGLIKQIGENMHVGGYWKCGDWSRLTVLRRGTCVCVVGTTWSDN